MNIPSSTVRKKRAVTPNGLGLGDTLGSSKTCGGVKGCSERHGREILKSLPLQGFVRIVSFRFQACFGSDRDQISCILDLAHASRS